MFQPDQGRERTRLSRLAAALTALTVALLASAAAIPAAFASELPGLYRHSAAALAPSATVQHTTGGITTWQVALIGVSVPLAAVILTIVLRRVRATRRDLHSPTA